MKPDKFIYVQWSEPTDALGRKRPGWYVMDGTQFAGRYDTEAQAERNAIALCAIRGRAQD